MAYNVANFIDDAALYLSLYRLPGETDESLTSRVKRFAKTGFGTDYSTQIRAIGEQVGASIYPVAEILCDYPYTIELDFNYLTIQTFPNDQTDPLFIRMFINDKENILSKLQELLVNEDRIQLNILKPSFLDLENKFILRECNYKNNKELIIDKYTRLVHGDLIDTLTQFENTPFVKNRVDTFNLVVNVGDYFFDPELGFLAINGGIKGRNFGISYTYFQKRFLIYASTVTLTPIKEVIKNGLNDNFISFFPSLLNNKTTGN